MKQPHLPIVPLVIICGSFLSACFESYAQSSPPEETILRQELLDHAKVITRKLARDNASIRSSQNLVEFQNALRSIDREELIKAQKQYEDWIKYPINSQGKFKQLPWPFNILWQVNPKPNTWETRSLPSPVLRHKSAFVDKTTSSPPR